jgi:hypothetical protein
MVVKSMFVSLRYVTISDPSIPLAIILTFRCLIWVYFFAMTLVDTVIISVFS